MLKIRNLSFSYTRKSRLIENFSMEIKPGSVCGLLGKNGAGKTTLLYLICGLLRPQSGEISYNGFTPIERKVNFLNDIFIVPEEFSLPNVTLEEFVNLNAPFYPKFDHRMMTELLETFDLSTGLHLGKLSMGQKKKTYLAFGMATNTSLLVLDEPTNGLDISSKRSFRKAVASCMNDQRSIIISTHQVYDVDKILDHIIITERNGVLLNAPVTEVAEKLRFEFTTDKALAEAALLALDVPGGKNIVIRNQAPDSETEINLETLFELATNSPQLIKQMFDNQKS